MSGAELPSGDLGGLSNDELVSALVTYEDARRTGRERAGRMLAELYRRGGYSWPLLARLTGMRQTTAYDMAKPFLVDDGADES